jgi:hypothetical protein
MRKIFAGAMLFSVIGAVILGGTLAWQNTQLVATNVVVPVGTLGWGSIYVQETDALLGPNGYVTTVGHGTLSNTGDFNIKLLASGSSVLIRNVDSGHSSCDPWNFWGTVQDLTGGTVIAPGTSFADGPNGPGMAYRVLIGVKDNAPFACMGALVTYDVYITIETTTNGGQNGNGGL